MLALGTFSVNDTHHVRVEGARCVVRVELTDPRNGQPVPVPGARVCLVGATGSVVSSGETTSGDGVASLLVLDAAAGARVHIDLLDVFDFDAGRMVANAPDEVSGGGALERLPAVWRSDRQATLLDDLGGRVKNGRLPQIAEGGQGTEESPWVLRLDHAWTTLDVSLSFYDTLAHRRATVGPDVMVDAFRPGSFGPDARVGGTSLVSEGHRLRLFEPVAPEVVVLRFETAPGSYVDLEDGRLQRLPSGTVTPLGERLRRYPLPEVWCSRGQLASIDDGATAQPFDELAAGLSSGASVEFDLDDVLLVAEDGRPINVRASPGVSLFGADFVVKRPRSDEPQHSDVVIDRPLLRGRDVYSCGVDASHPFAATRVIRRGRRFYELDGSRTRTGKVLGARAAIREAHQVVREPAAAIDGVARHRADFHLFEGVGVVEFDGQPHSVDVALVHISVRLRPRSGVTEKHLHAAARVFAEAANRWTGEPLSLHLSGSMGAGHHVYIQEGSGGLTRMVFHFPTTRTGRAMTNAFLVERDKEFRAHAVGGSVTLNVNTHLEATPTRDATNDLPGLFPAHTAAHEMGHVLGLPDEYVEVPGFLQPHRTLLHALENVSVMNDDHVPMLRHYYALGLALEEAGVRASPVQAVCETSPGALSPSTVYRYTHPLRDPYQVAAKFTFGPDSMEFDAFVGLRGRDFEFGDVGREDGVLVLSPKLYVRLKGRLSESVTPDRELAATNVQRHLSAWVRQGEEPLRVSFRRRSGAAGVAPERCWVCFVPRVSVGNPAAADARVHVLLAPAQSASPPFESRRRRVTIHDGQEGCLLRCLLGLSVRQQPRLVCKEAGGATVHFSGGGFKVTLREGVGPSAAAGTYVAKMPGPSGGFVPLEKERVAANLAAAINDPSNGLVRITGAEAHGAEVVLTPRTDDFEARAVGSRIESVPLFARRVEAHELQPLADALGAVLGTSYEVEL